METVTKENFKLSAKKLMSFWYVTISEGEESPILSVSMLSSELYHLPQIVASAQLTEQLSGQLVTLCRQFLWSLNRYAALIDFQSDIKGPILESYWFEQLTDAKTWWQDTVSYFEREQMLLDESKIDYPKTLVAITNSKKLDYARSALTFVEGEIIDS